MSLFYIKSILSLFFIAAGLIAFMCMFALMGRSERKLSPAFLRTTHRIAGVIFTVFLAVLSYICIKYVAMVGDQLSVRAVFHGVLALGLIAVFAMKIAIVQYYREFMRFVPTLGMIVFALAFVVFFTSAGYFFLRNVEAQQPSEAVTVTDVQPDIAPDVTGDAGRGSASYDARCSSCHHADSEDAMFGPGLKGILKKDVLPSTGRPTTAANIVRQLKTPAGMMPSFASLSDQEIGDLLAYLKTL
jgi:mono/diheme cytochrome c family protein